MCVNVCAYMRVYEWVYVCIHICVDVHAFIVMRFLSICQGVGCAAALLCMLASGAMKLGAFDSELSAWATTRAYKRIFGGSLGLSYVHILY